MQPYLGLYVPGSGIALATGGYALLYGYSGALLPGQLLNVASFTADGQLLGSAQLTAPPTAPGFPIPNTATLHALPDGGYVAAWNEGQPFTTGGGHAVIREFDASGASVGDSRDLGPIVLGSPGVQVSADGRYTVSWIAPWGAQQQTFLESDPPLGSQDAALALSQSADLSASGGWTGAAVLSDHRLAVAAAQDGGYGSHTGGVQLYDGAGALTGSASGIGYGAAGAAFSPHVTALAVGGFYEVSFAGSTDYAIFNGANQQVFTHNAYTSGDGTFIPLTSGGYVVADFTHHVMGVFDASGANAGWVNVGLSKPEAIVSLSDGGFAFGYGDSVTAFDGAGHVEFSARLGADKASGFASQMAALADGRLAEVWLSPNGGFDGLPTTLVLQVFGGGGGSGAVVLGQNLDPWHTQFAIQAHADGSAAVLWSEGGGIFGLEYGSGGVTTGAHAAMAGDLSATLALQLAGNDVGLVYLQGGDVWAEVFDPGTGSVSRADLGASSGDLSTVHALATADGGLAVSWHSGSGVVGATMDAWGSVGPVTALPGDFLGVDGQGHAITVHDAGGHPLLQTYALSDGGLFWAP